MKKLVMVALVVLLAAGAAVAQTQSVLIDFTELVADWPADDPTQHEATIFDFSGSRAAQGLPDDLQAQLKSSLAIENWDVELSSSSRFVDLVANSLVRPATVSDNATRYPGDTVLGVRASFPTEPFNSYAIIRPPFEIPAYADPVEVDADGTVTVAQENVGTGTQFDGFGVVKNVGILRSVIVNAFANNYPHGLSVLMENERNEVQEIFLGYLDFDGWRTLQWDNPNYIQNVRNRELRRSPLYPNLAPFQKLVGFVIYRDGAQIGGDFISYIADVTLVYDRAVLTLDRDINDEQVWGILQEREQARREAELSRLGEIQVLRFLEEQRQVPADEQNQE